MIKNPKVSIIVPVYNTEKYLRLCLDSIVGQTLRDIEIILINDGSSDDSMKIIKEYAKLDNRVTVIDKPNEGYGKTMNCGINAANGKYIGIVESDDWIEPDMYESLYTLAEKHGVQVVKSNFFNYTTAKETLNKSVLPDDDLEMVIDPKKRSEIFLKRTCIWSAIYHREFLNNNKIRFLESPGASYQDIGFNFKVWILADKVWLTPKAYLHYRTDNDNQSVKSQDKVFCVCDEWKEILRFLDDHPELKKASYQLRNHVMFNDYKWNFLRLKGEKREEFRKIFALEYEDILKNNGLDRNHVSNEDWLKLLRALHPKSCRLKIRRAMNKTACLFVKTRVSGSKKHWLLFGAIRIKMINLEPLDIHSRLR